MAKKDFFGGGEAGAPGVTWKGAPEPSTIEGIILPIDVSTSDTLAFDTVQATSVGQDPEPLFWAPKGVTPRRTTKSHGPNGEPLDEVWQGVMLLQTEYRNMEFMTRGARDRFAEEDKKDDGLRRHYSQGAEGNAIREAIKKAKAPGRKPEVGARLVITLTKREPNNYGGETNVVEAQYFRPTPETKAVAQKYIDDNKAEVSSDGGYFAGSGAEDDNEPPF